LLNSETHGSNFSVLSEEVGKRNPHRSDFAAARRTDLIQSSSGYIFYRLRLLVPLLPGGSGGVLNLFMKSYMSSGITGLAE
jgi:hypothetical protein